MSQQSHLVGLRAEGQAQFTRLGLPSRKIEAWHYTDLSQSDVTALPLAEPGAMRPVGDDEILLVNGCFAGHGALPDGVTLELASQADAPRLGGILPAASMPMVALNSGLFHDAVIIRIAAGHQIDRTLRLRCESDSALQSHGRILLLVEAGASLSLIETQRGKGAYFANWAVEIDLAERARLEHVLLQDADLEATQIESVGLHLAANACYKGVLLQLGSRLSRFDLLASLSGACADFSLDGASLALARQHLDNTTRIIHRAPSCPSRQLFKTVLADEGHGVFQGNVLVERAAQKTHAHQLSRALMLSDRAEMDAKPELEIYADDVKCGHGATIGDIDPAQLFYLRARGIDEAQARQLLIEAFLAEIIDAITDEAMRADINSLLQHRLALLEAA